MIWLIRGASVIVRQHMFVNFMCRLSFKCANTFSEHHFGKFDQQCSRSGQEHFILHFPRRLDQPASLIDYVLTSGVKNKKWKILGEARGAKE